MKKLLLLIPSIILLLFIISCVSPENIPTVKEKIKEVPTVKEKKIDKKPLENNIEKPNLENSKIEVTKCVLNSECEHGFYCIEEKCAKIESLNQDTAGCSLCTFQSATIETSDGETYTEGQGKGSYTYAGALEWVILPMPKYCKGDTAVPIKVFTRNYGEIFSDEVISLKKDQTSKIFTHKLIDSIKFTLKVTNIEESCS